MAIQEVWTRVAALSALATCSDIGPSLKPLQLGVGIRGGLEAMGHALRSALDANPESVLVQIEFKTPSTAFPEPRYARVSIQDGYQSVYIYEALGDVLLTMPQGIAIADFSVIQLTSLNTLSRPAATAGATASHQDRQKQTAYARVEPNGYSFVPF
jgi:hypothetical protein